MALGGGEEVERPGESRLERGPDELEVPDSIIARRLADRILIDRNLMRPVRGRVSAVPQVWTDIDQLMAANTRVPAGWELSQNEADRVGDRAYALIDSLADDPMQGEPMEYSDDAIFLGLCRRLAFDPVEYPPRALDGEPWPRLSLFWSNLPDAAAAVPTRVLAVIHRLDQSLLDRASSGFRSSNG